MKTILITGASSGIGLAAALCLAERGYEIYAGVRKTEDADRILKIESRLKPVFLDVTNNENIQSVFQRIDAEFDRRHEFCLINNAGIAMSLPMECVPMSEVRKQFEVNYFGVLAVTQIFLPLIRLTRGRIVNVSSIAGRFTYPFMGPYSSSKFALEAMTAALRRELKELEVKVISINPGPVQTPIWNKGEEWGRQMQSHCSKEAIQVYSEALKRFEERVKISAQKAIHPSEVAEAITLALEKKNPRTHYFVGRKTKVKALAARFLSDKMLDYLIQKSLK